MEIYQSEEEQVEAIKRWWDKNGKQTLLLIAIGLMTVVGVQQWMANQKSKIEYASSLYQEMVTTYDNDWSKAQEIGRTIVADFSDTHYAILTSLMLAKGAVEHDDLPAAEAHLKWVLSKHADEAHTQLATVRLARVMMAQDRLDEALSTLSGIKAGSFSALANELEGDIYLRKGDQSKARDAYNKALGGYESLPERKNMVQMKIDDLAEASAQ